MEGETALHNVHTLRQYLDLAADRRRASRCPATPRDDEQLTASPRIGSIPGAVRHLLSAVLRSDGEHRPQAATLRTCKRLRISNPPTGLRHLRHLRHRMSQALSPMASRPGPTAAPERPWPTSPRAPGRSRTSPSPRPSGILRVERTHHRAAPASQDTNSNHSEGPTQEASAGQRRLGALHHLRRLSRPRRQIAIARRVRSTAAFDGGTVQPCNTPATPPAESTRADEEAGG